MQCPKCGELNEPERAECCNCRTKLDPEPESPSSRRLDADLKPLGGRPEDGPKQEAPMGQPEPVQTRAEGLPGAAPVETEAKEESESELSRPTQLLINSMLYGAIMGAIMIGLLAAVQTAAGGKIIPQALWFVLIPQIPPDAGLGLGLLIGVLVGAISGAIIGSLVALAGDGVDTGWKAGMAMVGGVQLMFMLAGQGFGRVALLHLLLAAIKGAIYGGVLGWLIEQSVER